MAFFFFATPEDIAEIFTDLELALIADDIVDADGGRDELALAEVEAAQLDGVGLGHERKHHLLAELVDHHQLAFFFAASRQHHLRGFFRVLRG